jgi:hypothetical protein
MVNGKTILLGTVGPGELFTIDLFTAPVTFQQVISVQQDDAEL